MNCQEVNKFSQTYLDGEFASHERGEFEEHLRRCPPCRGAVDREAQLRDVVARHLRPAPCAVRSAHTAALRGKLCAQFDCLERRQRNRAIGTTVASVAVVAVAVVALYGVPAEQALPLAVQPIAQRQPQPRRAPPRIAQAEPVAVAAAPEPQAVPGTVGHGAISVGHGAPARLPVLAVAAPAGNPHVQTVAARLDLGLDRGNGGQPGGQLHAQPVGDRSALGAARSPQALRTLVQVHLANLQPEITGSPARIQRYLQARVAGLSALPLAQGAGVQLLGARIHVLGSQPAVIYQYVAFGSALTVVSRPRTAGDDGEIEAAEPETRAPSGLLLDRHSGLHLLHAVTADRLVTLVGELAPQAMVQLLPSAPIL